MQTFPDRLWLTPPVYINVWIVCVCVFVYVRRAFAQCKSIVDIHVSMIIFRVINIEILTVKAYRALVTLHTMAVYKCNGNWPCTSCKTFDPIENNLQFNEITMFGLMQEPTGKPFHFWKKNKIIPEKSGECKRENTETRAKKVWRVQKSSAQKTRSLGKWMNGKKSSRHISIATFFFLE